MSGERIQLHVTHPYKIEIREHPVVGRRLDEGWRVVHVHRLTDHEALVTLDRAAG